MNAVIESMKPGPWIRTRSGRFHFTAPSSGEIDIKDIAHALSNVCRFGGHTSTFYSVAEHSYRASKIVKPWAALMALLHDAQEAYCHDISTPIKQHAGMDWYRQIEDEIQWHIYQKYGVFTPGLLVDQQLEVWRADRAMFGAEARDLMPADAGWEQWSEEVPADPEVIVPVSPEVARMLFLSRFHELHKEAA